MRPHGKYHRVNPRYPEAKGICDRCGMSARLIDLGYQYQWAGQSLVNLHWRVHDHCMDVPNETLRTIHIPADPRPVRDPRPRNFDISRNDYVSDETGSAILDESGNMIVRD